MQTFKKFILTALSIFMLCYCSMNNTKNITNFEYLKFKKYFFGKKRLRLHQVFFNKKKRKYRKELLRELKNWYLANKFNFIDQNGNVETTEYTIKKILTNIKKFKKKQNEITFPKSMKILNIEDLECIKNKTDLDIVHDSHNKNNVYYNLIGIKSKNDPLTVFCPTCDYYEFQKKMSLNGRFFIMLLLFYSAGIAFPYCIYRIYKYKKKYNKQYMKKLKLEFEKKFIGFEKSFNKFLKNQKNTTSNVIIGEK